MKEITDLEQILNESLQNYCDEIEYICESKNDRICTKDDLEEFGRQTFYAISQLKNELISFLKSQQDIVLEDYRGVTFRYIPLFLGYRVLRSPYYTFIPGKLGK